MHLLSKELQRFAARPANWWVAGVLFVYVLTLLVVMAADDDERPLATLLTDGAHATATVALALPAAIAGILLVAGTRGEMRALLAAEPRRDVVYRTKIGAAALGVAPGVAVAYVVHAGGAWAIHAMAGTLVAPGAGGPGTGTGGGNGEAAAIASGTAELAADLAWAGLRVVALAACAAALGAALGAMIGRRSVAVLVLCLALLGIERAARGLDAPGWSVLMNARAWVAGPGAEGLSPGGAGPWWLCGLIVLAVTAVVVGAGVPAFRRRELR